MRIATALYDRFGTLAAPDKVFTPTGFQDNLTLESGFWHRYYNNFDTAHQRDVALRIIDDELRRHNATPVQVEVCDEYYVPSSFEINARAVAGLPPKHEGYRYIINIAYVVEDHGRVPFYRLPSRQVDPQWIPPVDLVAEIGDLAPV